MSFRACPREKELANLLELGHWPDASPKELRAHVAECASCRARVAVTRAFRGERDRAIAEPRLESPGVLWWRAQLRRRNSAMERLSRPLLGAQIFAILVVLAAAGAYLGWQVRQGATWFGDLARALHFTALLPPALQSSPVAGVAMVLLVALVALAGGVAVYFASDR